MTALATAVLNKTTGAVPALVAASTSDTCEGTTATGRIFVVYRNTNAATRTVTAVVPGNETYGPAKPDPTYTLGATTGELWIPVDPAFVDPTTGQCTFTLDASAGVTVVPVKIA